MYSSLQRNKRYPVTLFIGDSEESIPLGRSRDISASGLFIETVKRPEVNSQHEIRFVWGTREFSSVANIVRHSDDGVGIEFVNPDPLLLRAIRELTGQEFGY